MTLNRDHPVDRLYLTFLDQLETLMQQAHQRLGLYRTSQKLHAALDEARAEVHEAIPDVITGRFAIGPVSEQPSTRRPS